MAIKKKVKSPRTYHLHRERQRCRILEAAKMLFEERGIDRTTMAEVVSASGLQPSTLYEYYSNKDDIVWAILGEVREEGAASAKKRLEGATTGLSKILGLFQYMADELSNSPAKVHFMSQFDAMYARDWPAERLLTLERQTYDDSLNFFRTLILEGIGDGSLRADLDPDLTLHAVINAVVGAQRRLASLGSKVESEYGHSIDRLFRETIRIVEYGLRATASSNITRTSSRVKARKSKTRKRSS
jgi:AcrR family transcriptional regulator